MGNYYSTALLIYASDGDSYFKLMNFSVVIEEMERTWSNWADASSNSRLPESHSGYHYPMILKENKLTI